MLRAFRKLYSGDSAFQRFQDNVADTFNRITRILLLDGNLVTVSLDATVAEAIEHKLGRQPEGWVIVDKDADASVYRTAWTSSTITLVSDANVNLKLWVF